MEQRLVNLEEKILFLDRHVEELDGSVREAFEEIAKTRRQLQALNDLVRRLQEPGDEDQEEDAG